MTSKIRHYRGYQIWNYENRYHIYKPTPLDASNPMDYITHAYTLVGAKAKIRAAILQAEQGRPSVVIP